MMAGGPISPGYGLRVKDTTSVEVVTSRVEALPLANSILAEGTNYTLSLQLPQHRLATVPVVSEAAYLPTFGGIGSLAYQNDLQTLVVRDYSGIGAGCCPTTAPTRLSRPSIR